MTDPTPIAADSHVSGRVEELPVTEAARRLYRTLEMSAAIMRDPARTSGWEGSEQTASAFERQAIAAKRLHTRLAANTVPANADGVREAAQNVIDRMFSTYKARNGREVGIEGDDGEKCWIVHSDDIEQLRRVLTIRPTDNAAREVAIIAATVERCAKVQSLIDAARPFAWCAKLLVDHADEEWVEPDSGAVFQAGNFRALDAAIHSLNTPDHIADATEGDTAAHDEGMVLVPREPTEAMRTAGKDYLSGDPNASYRNIASGCWSAMIAAAPEAAHGR